MRLLATRAELLLIYAVQPLLHHAAEVHMHTTIANVRRFLSVGVAGIAIVVMAPGIAHAQEDPELCSPAGEFRVFEQRVEDYAAFHRYLQDILPPMNGVPDTGALRISRHAVATALRSARVHAAQGNIFATPVAEMFDCLIAVALVDSEIDPSAGVTRGLPLPYGVHPRVNEAYGDHLLLEVPSFLSVWLPALPGEIEYRVFDHDLVLWDIYAEVVIDFLPEAFPRPDSEDW